MALDTDKITLSVTSLPKNGTAAEEVSGEYSSEGFEIGFQTRAICSTFWEKFRAIAWKLHLSDASAPTLIRENDKSEATVRAHADAGVNSVPFFSQGGSKSRTKLDGFCQMV